MEVQIICEQSEKKKIDVWHHPSHTSDSTVITYPLHYQWTCSLSFIPRLHDQAIIKQTLSKYEACIKHSLHAAIIEQTSSRHWANVAQTSSKCRANIDKR